MTVNEDVTIYAGPATCNACRGALDRGTVVVMLLPGERHARVLCRPCARFLLLELPNEIQTIYGRLTRAQADWIAQTLDVVAQAAGPVLVRLDEQEPHHDD
jgi:hypothetical protein